MKDNNHEHTRVMLEVNKKDFSEAIKDGIERFCEPFWKMIIGIIILGCIVQFLPLFKDNTDPPFGRSGMSILTDNLTGCEYLESRRGLTPRIGADNNQLGCRETGFNSRHQRQSSADKTNWILAEIKEVKINK
ncbi:hypothetical protein MNBD_GAMMA04-841 [hydrothermal vent metagenome]|uniref:Uncharacterized protein n=1 Tax=hydrothermal vent metagenome TaxID=652676 RepID=A0A3B0WFH0_9ZZZZ